PEPALQGMDAVIHLAGEPVSQRWNREVKRRIRESRVTGTRALVAAMRKIPKPPQTLVSASAVGYYGDRGEELLNESSPPGAGFLPEVTVDWEHAALDAQALGVRVVPLRIGIVLGSGGALKMMLPPFRMGVGGPLGSGRQWMSWIHVDDLVDLILFAFNLDRLSGPINAVSPVPLRNSEFTQALGSAVHRPAFFPVPKLALSVLFGEMAGVMLSSQRVVPNAAELARFPFRYRDVQPALKAAVASFRT
ncbi:MAG TPA: TIGR01777 family oxidoreductase, partial [Bryobacteraceae bacterium]|nr:TIGR01777 family oxidoreductase [Bryobacteraceae bacterium]